MSPRDGRLHAFRQDLADERLAGEVEAEQFVAGRAATVAVPVADLRREPRPDAGLSTQLLLGDPVRVYEEREGWAWLQSERDGYVGYAGAGALGPVPTSLPSHIVRVPRTFVYPGPDLKSPPLATLSLGARLRVSDRAETRGRPTLSWPAAAPSWPDMLPGSAIRRSRIMLRLPRACSARPIYGVAPARSDWIARVWFSLPCTWPAVRCRATATCRPQRSGPRSTPPAVCNGATWCSGRAMWRCLRIRRRSSTPAATHAGVARGFRRGQAAHRLSLRRADRLSPPLISTPPPGRPHCRAARPARARPSAQASAEPDDWGRT